MITFFRKIRKKLADDNQFIKYSRYAIGEILLVVVGILIALQVNNWNEWRKERIQEKKILVELKNSLETNCVILENDSIIRLRSESSSDLILTALQQKLEYSESLGINFQRARITYTNVPLILTAYDALKDMGIDIITSDTLRNEIVELFEISYKRFKELTDYFELFQPARQVKIDELFMYDDSKFDKSKPRGVSLIPHNYDALVHDVVYISLIKSVKVQRSVIGVSANYSLNESKRVLKLIDKELENID